MRRTDDLRNVYIGLGSNLGDPEAQLRKALQCLDALADTQVESVSPLFRTAPVGPQDQPEFLNAVAHLRTRVPADALLSLLKDIEQQIGRTPTRHWGERVIDLDILDYEGTVLHAPHLILPHAHIGERGFVLVPLHAIAPALVLADGRKIESLYRICNKDGICYHGEVEWRTAP